MSSILIESQRGKAKIRPLMVCIVSKYIFSTYCILFILAGIWADSESEDEDDSKGKKKSDYSAPIGFVKSGIQQSETSKAPSSSSESKSKSKSKPSSKNRQTGFTGIRSAGNVYLLWITFTILTFVFIYSFLLQ